MMDPTTAITGTILGLLSIVAIVNVIRRKNLRRIVRVIWITVCFLPLIGPLVYFLWYSTPDHHGRDDSFDFEPPV
jgi:hypothetical protein